MNAKEFFDAVSEMREAQNLHTVEDTVESFTRKKQTEKVVDNEIQRVRQIMLDKQARERLKDLL